MAIACHMYHYVDNARNERLINDEKAVMLREIALQSDFVRANVDVMYAGARETLRSERNVEVKAGFTIGCGDSFCAALAARAYMLAKTQRWFEAVEALQFSEYLVAALPPESVVFGVSNSGSVARTIDGVRRAREHGAWTVALTAASESELAQTARTLVSLNAVPNIKVQADGTKLVTPGTITYLASLLGLYVCAVALGERLGALSAAAAAAAIDELRELADPMAEADLALRVAMAEIASVLSPERTLVIVGGGPNEATAHYAAAKLYESVQWPAHHAPVEEWAHEHYFVTGPRTDTIVIAAPGAARERALTHVRAARDMGSRTIVLGAQGDVAARAAGDLFIGLPDEIPEALTPFVYKLPFDYLACRLAQQHKTSFFAFADPLRQQVNFRQIFKQ